MQLAHIETETLILYGDMSFYTIPAHSRQCAVFFFQSLL
jgi:hypothetical protein